MLNQLTSAQRKLVYLVIIALLLVPIIWLGRPAVRAENGEMGTGGLLAQKRTEYQLGETSLGNVNPASSTMNLVLLGFRGVATNLLWQQALEAREQKQWARLRSTVRSIILLQPHYIKVWDFQAWNLAYNVSAEWDLVADRWYWVKEGGKFYMKGTARNSQNAKLVHKTGQLLSQKVGRSDEWDFFRDYFVDDPNDVRFGANHADPAFNRGYDNPGPYNDNYLAARDWFLEANRRQVAYRQTSLGLQLELFRSYPAHIYFGMANALRREGRFGERSQDAWASGHEAWTQEYGSYTFPSDIGPYHLEVTDPSEYARMARENSKALGQEITAAMMEGVVTRRQNTTNYRYWRMRSEVEMKTETVKAHRDIYEGEQLYELAELDESAARIREGLAALERIFGQHEEFKRDQLIREEALLAMVYLRSINFLQNGLVDGNKVLPKDTPLYEELWVPIQGKPLEDQMERRFIRQTRRENDE